ncbi:hypothetical protein P7K49_014550 [Saguinus oedipus]|uniref:Cyclin N-terminal domain-containing protein n=1 Tax=Saguinus oedipus TaxID=9490 RepID=A0ABQ9VJ35_SAGOE|nr:hypothetical protein P7K49_014550 [Saguinus oedipus]
MQWLLQLQNNLYFSQFTFNLVLPIFSTLLILAKVKEKYLHCATIVSLRLAAKLNEENEAIPQVNHFINLYGSDYSMGELLSMELAILDTLHWDLYIGTPLNFLTVFHALVVLSLSHVLELLPQRNPSLHVVSLTRQLRHCMVGHPLLQFKGSTLALVIITLELERIMPDWCAPISSLLKKAQKKRGEKEETEYEYSGSEEEGDSHGEEKEPSSIMNLQQQQQQDPKAHIKYLLHQWQWHIEEQKEEWRPVKEQQWQEGEQQKLLEKEQQWLEDMQALQWEEEWQQAECEQKYKRKQLEEQQQSEHLQRQLQQEHAYLKSLQQQLLTSETATADPAWGQEAPVPIYYSSYAEAQEGPHKSLVAHRVPLKPYPALVPRFQSLQDQPTKNLAPFPASHDPDPDIPAPTTMPSARGAVICQNSDHTSKGLVSAQNPQPGYAQIIRPHPRSLRKLHLSPLPLTPVRLEAPSRPTQSIPDLTATPPGKSICKSRQSWAPPSLKGPLLNPLAHPTPLVTLTSGGVTLAENTQTASSQPLMGTSPRLAHWSGNLW